MATTYSFFMTYQCTHFRKWATVNWEYNFENWYFQTKKKRLNIWLFWHVYRNKKIRILFEECAFFLSAMNKKWIGFDFVQLFSVRFYLAVEKKPMSNLNPKYGRNVLGIHWIAIWRCFNNPAELYLNYSIYRKFRNNRQNNSKRQRTQWNSFLS